MLSPRLVPGLLPNRAKQLQTAAADSLPPKRGAAPGLDQGSAPGAAPTRLHRGWCWRGNLGEQLLRHNFLF